MRSTATWHAAWGRISPAISHPRRSRARSRRAAATTRGAANCAHGDEERRLRALARLRIRETGSPPEEPRPAEEPRLAEALGALSADERDVLLLFAWAGFGYAEIATVLDVPLGTVRSRLHRAREHVRTTLEREEALDG